MPKVTPWPWLQAELDPAAFAASRLECILWRAEMTLERVDKARDAGRTGQARQEAHRGAVLCKAARKGLALLESSDYTRLYALVSEAERYHMRMPNQLRALLSRSDRP